MNKVLILIVLLTSFFKPLAQDRDSLIAWQKSIGDKWFNEHIDASLKVGDTMPDIDLGTVTNNYTGKTKFSDFKGKLVILDFWGINCSSCISAFPEMERLQKEFGNKIQIFIVNTSSDQRRIDEGLKKIYKKSSKSILPNLPSVVGPREDLKKLFPTRLIPHHVWIDSNGIIKMIGTDANTYPEKIRNLLSRKDVFYMSGGNNVPLFNKEEPYYKLIGKHINPNIYNSFFTPYNNYYTSMQGGMVESKKDTINHTIRNTYINEEAEKLYSYAVFKKAMDKNRERIIRTPNMKIWGYPNKDFLILLVNDSSKYTSFFKKDERVIDEEYMKSRVCYEQITPAAMPEEERKERMLQDLNSYFGITGSLTAKKVECYTLIRTSKKDKLKSFANEVSNESFIDAGKKMFRVAKINLKMALQPWFLAIQKKGFRSFVLDETDYNGEVDLTLPDPSELSNIEELRIALKRYDLDLVKNQRELDFVVLKEKGYKGNTL